MVEKILIQLLLITPPQNKEHIPWGLSHLSPFNDLHKNNQMFPFSFISITFIFNVLSSLL